MILLDFRFTSKFISGFIVNPVNFFYGRDKLVRCFNGAFTLNFKDNYTEFNRAGTEFHRGRKTNIFEHTSL